MPPSSRIPPLLQPYTTLPPKDSLIVLSNVLGASANWLVIRFLCDALKERNSLLRRAAGGQGYGGLEDSSGNMKNGVSTEDEGDVAVVLVSWMRDWEFWRTEGRKAGGLDLNRHIHEKRFAFIDGLSNLFLPPSEAPSHGTAPLPSAQPQQNTVRTTPLPTRSPRPINPRGPPASNTPSTTPQTPTESPIPSANSTQGSIPGHFNLTSPSLTHLEETIQRAITHLITSPARKIVLILDQPDLLLALAGSSPHSPQPTASTIPLTSSTLPLSILKLRTQVHSMLLVVSADTPLVSVPSSASGVAVPLEVEGAAFVMRMVHQAERVMSLRLLDTGVARDVSGVLRVTVRGRGFEAWDDGDGDADGKGEGGVGKEDGSVDGEEEVEEKELLYYVGGDGSVKVFERGAGDSAVS